MGGVSLLKQPSIDCHKALLMISQHWFGWWLGAVRQQAITWTNVVQDLCRHMALLGLNELTHLSLDTMAAISQTTFSDAFLWIKVCILIKISLKFVPKGPINNKTALFKKMAGRRIGAKPLSEPCWPKCEIFVFNTFQPELFENFNTFEHIFKHYVCQKYV